jgi:hypothetical protein
MIDDRRRMDIAKPQPEHIWLEKLLGNWTYEGEVMMGPDVPPVKSSGTETVRTMGGLWFVCQGSTTMPGGEPAEMMITIGYDPESKRYTGTWIGSMMTRLWVYDGFVDGNTLNLDAKGPSMSGDGTITTYRDSIEFVDDDQRILRSQVLGSDGVWTPFMSAHYRRV